MQEEVEKQTIALAFKATKFTADVFENAIKRFLEKSINAAQEQKEPQGEMTVAELVGKGSGAKTMEVNPDSVKTFRKVAMKYDVDFAIKRDDTGNPPTYLVFFQGKDTDVIKQAFKEYVFENEKNKSKESVHKKLNEKTKEVEIAKNKHKDKSRNTNRDLSL